MLNFPESHLLASNAGVLAAENFLVPMTLSSEGKGLDEAFRALQQAFEEIKKFLPPRMADFAPDLRLLEFDATISPRLSKIHVTQRKNDRKFDLTFSLRCPIPANMDLWARIHFIAQAYERLAGLNELFESWKGVDLCLHEARLEPENEGSERLPTSVKGGGPW